VLSSVSKKFLEPMRRQRGIARRILNIAMPEIRLDRAGVVAVVGELVAAGMATASRAPAPPANEDTTMMSAGAIGSLMTSAQPAARRTGSRTEGNSNDDSRD
jgi:hypothetical protein